ncbi:acyl-CoA thioesterase II [Elsinoe ampelina]|uniref:Acyl-CoA thioesterase II n=1 Tax=Elsinoe ampelina TaxID=302913 RepID=A0A6A6G9H5_9PEZI|nr:acyl-CoA thioesterase II [Elsinoe ampelina]
MAQPPSRTILDVVGAREISPGVFESQSNPEEMGNARAIAYGGCALGVAAMAAHQHLPEGHRLYSMAGNYLGPALTDRKLLCRVQDIRNTRTFTTRLVTVSQKQNDGSDRSCLVTLLDFQKIEPASLFTYSKPPSQKYKDAESYSDFPTRREKALKQGKITPQMAALHAKSFGLMSRMFDSRPCDEGIVAQTMSGMIKDSPTTQDHLPLTDRTSADWWRCRTSLPSRADNASTLAFIMDGAVSFIPLTHQRMFLDDAGACSSLDFSMRIFTNELDLTKWHLREWKTISGAVGRTYSESQLWDENGVMVASMTQASIMRPKAVPKGKL